MALSPLNGPPSPVDRAKRGAAVFDRCSELGRLATLRGDFIAAARAYRRAQRVAHWLEDDARSDAAALNVAMVQIQTGDAKAGEDGLREILLRAGDPKTAFTAAYHLASSLRRQNRHDKATSYARRALERAERLGAVDLLAAAHNLLGNILLAQSYHDEALQSYRKSLDLRESTEDDTRYGRAILLENMGYCHLLRKEFDTGIELIREALELAEEVGDERCRAECLQDLCYGHLLTGKHGPARRYGSSALELAVRNAYADIEENCHYLLGEVGNKTGDHASRDRHFRRLQELHPELPFLEDFLCAVDVTRIITLKR